MIDLIFNLFKLIASGAHQERFVLLICDHPYTIKRSHSKKTKCSWGASLLRCTCNTECYKVIIFWRFIFALEIVKMVDKNVWHSWLKICKPPFYLPFLNCGVYGLISHKNKMNAPLIQNNHARSPLRCVN